MLPDGVLSDLAEAMSYRPRRGSDPGAKAATKKLLLAQRIGSGGSPAERAQLALKVMSRIARKAPEVVVKVTGSKAVGGATAAHLRYIGRVGHPEERAVHMENEKGEVLDSQNGLALDRVAEQWESWELEDGARRSGKVSNAMVFSLAPGADPAKVLAATRETMAELFPEHRYVMALHNDTAHPHVHVAYALRNTSGQRTFLSHGDKQQLRETFAEKLRDLGVDANATLRKTRGLDEQPDRKGLHHRRKEGRDVRIDKDAVSDARRQRRQARHRDLIQTVFSRSIDVLSRSGDPEQAAMAKSLSAFIAPATPTPATPDRAGENLVELGGEQIDLAKLDASTRREVEAMVAKARERDERDLGRRAGVTVDEAGRRSVRLGGEQIDIDSLDPSSRREVLEMAAKARERDTRLTGAPRPAGQEVDRAAVAPDKSLGEAAERVRSSTKNIEQAIRDRSKDRGGPER